MGYYYDCVQATLLVPNKHLQRTAKILRFAWDANDDTELTDDPVSRIQNFMGLIFANDIYACWLDHGISIDCIEFSTNSTGDVRDSESILNAIHALANADLKGLELDASFAAAGEATKYLVTAGQVAKKRGYWGFVFNDDDAQEIVT